MFVNLQKFSLHSYCKDRNCLLNNNKNATEFAPNNDFRYIKMKKEDIRRSIKLQTRSLSEQRRVQESLAVVEQLRYIIGCRAPKVVALFAPLWDEVQLQELADCLSCRVVLPRVEGDDMEFYDYSPTNLKEGAFGIMEPQGCTPCPACDIDLMVVPGVAFTKEGERLGRGKGFYDRYLSREGFRGFCIGVGYKHQLLDSLPTEPHDRQMDMVTVYNE